MFKKNTYITKGIQGRLSVEIIALLWDKVQSVDDNKRKLDYLQVFNLRNAGPYDNPVIEVKWRQEQPRHFEKFYIRGLTTDVDKVWVICSGAGTTEEYSTMLLPEEY